MNVPCLQPYESGQKSGSSDVYTHEMPGGQFTNLLFQVRACMGFIRSGADK